MPLEMLFVKWWQFCPGLNATIIAYIFRHQQLKLTDGSTLRPVNTLDRYLDPGDLDSRQVGSAIAGVDFCRDRLVLPLITFTCKDISRDI